MSLDAAHVGYLPASEDASIGTGDAEQARLKLEDALAELEAAIGFAFNRCTAPENDLAETIAELQHVCHRLEEENVRLAEQNTRLKAASAEAMTLVDAAIAAMRPLVKEDIR